MYIDSNNNHSHANSYSKNIKKTMIDRICINRAFAFSRS